jgi:short-subunit dehydrogenase
LIEHHGVHVETFPIDLSARTAPVRLLEATSRQDIGLLVAAAGFGTSGAFAQNSIDTELEMIDVNCRAVVELCHGVAQRMVERGRGGIVLFGSLVGWQGTPSAATYAATKAFIQCFAEGIGDELAHLGVDVLSCAPGPVDSGFAARANMAMNASDSPSQIARESLKVLGRRRTVVPGRIGKALTWSLALLPRQSRVTIMGRIMRGMSRSSGKEIKTANSQSA